MPLFSKLLDLPMLSISDREIYNYSIFLCIGFVFSKIYNPDDAWWKIEIYVVEWIDSAKGTVEVVFENDISVRDICKRWADHLHVCC